MPTTTAMPDGGAPTPVLTQVRMFAAVLHGEAGVLREAVARLNAYALSLRWESSSARACLDELADISRRMTAFAHGHDEVARAVLTHADQAEAAAATLVRTMATATVNSFG